MASTPARLLRAQFGYERFQAVAQIVKRLRRDPPPALAAQNFFHALFRERLWHWNIVRSHGNLQPIRIGAHRDRA